MPQNETVTDGMNNLAAVQALITAATGDIAANVKITAADINAISGIYNSWNVHEHTVLDVAFVAFGNTPGRSNESAIDTTSTPRSTSDVVFPTIQAEDAVTIGGTVNLTLVNIQVANINAIRTHRHTITDNV